MGGGQERQAITLVMEWRGGRGVDVVSLVHNGERIRYAPRHVQVQGTSATIEYDVTPAAHHDVRAVLAFIGDARADLALHCFVDGRAVGAPVRAPHAEHRWEVTGSWALPPREEPGPGPGPQS